VVVVVVVGGGTRRAEAAVGPGECGVLGTTLPSTVFGSRIWDIGAVAKFEATVLVVAIIAVIYHVVRVWCRCGCGWGAVSVSVRWGCGY
jgi:hypothetical protein